ncbi:response regulator transcription factor [Priestia megaterium]
MSRLLLLEDEVGIGETLKEILEMEGYEVDWFTTGDGAVNSVIGCSNQYDLMILDVMLKASEPNVYATNGFEVARVIARHRTIPYMFLTSLSEGKDIMHGLDSGAEDYVKKPYELSELLARIRAILRRYNNKSESAQELFFMV